MLKVQFKADSKAKNIAKAKTKAYTREEEV